MKPLFAFFSDNCVRIGERVYYPGQVTVDAPNVLTEDCVLLCDRTKALDNILANILRRRDSSIAIDAQGKLKQDFVRRDGADLPQGRRAQQGASPVERKFNCAYGRVKMQRSRREKDVIAQLNG